MSNHIADANKMVDTPRMNSVAGHARGIVDAAIFAEGMKLERELNAANDRIKRLEEAGDALYENSDPTRWDSLQAANRKLDEQEAWRKAKEAKPCRYCLRSNCECSDSDIMPDIGDK